VPVYIACQAAIEKMESYSQTLHGVKQRGENKRQSENDSEMKTVSYVKGSENRQEMVQTDKEERIDQGECFEFRVKLMQ